MYPLRRGSCRLQKEQVVNQLCVISNCCSPLDPDRPERHPHTCTNGQMSTGRSTGQQSETQRPDRIRTGGLRKSDRYGLGSSRQTEEHTDSAHLPALKHFNHLTANYSGARQSRTETHTSLPRHSQMALQAGSAGRICNACLHSTCLLS